MVKFDRRIEPGKEGRITLSMKISPKWGGRRISKTALVRTNDDKNDRFVVKLTVHVQGAPESLKVETGSREKSKSPDPKKSTRPAKPAARADSSAPKSTKPAAQIDPAASKP